MLERVEKRHIERKRLVPGPAERPRPDQPPGTDLIPKIKHIVVLMMENHSYDNYLGMLAGRGDGLLGAAAGTPSAINALPNGQHVGAHHLTATTQTPGNPTQTWHASHLSYGDGNCAGFARAIWEIVPGGDPAIPMGYWTEEELPFYYGLARTFPVADRWFCSCLGPTFPNRRFLISGTAHGLIDDLLWDMVDYPPAGTIFDALTSNDISWVNYHNVQPALVMLQRALGRHGLIALRRLASLGRWLPAVTNAVRGNKSFTADLYPLGSVGARRHLRSTQQFFADAAAGNAARGVASSTRTSASARRRTRRTSRTARAFAGAVINAVMHGPAWESTLLVWTYDEHGGYYDHVPPPAAVAPDDVPARNWQLSRPWARR